MTNLVLQSIFDAFVEGAVTVPAVIASSGFPDELTVSYSPIGEITPLEGVTIPSGFYFNGAFNFLNYTGRAEIAVDPTNGFLVDLDLAPLT